MKENLKMICLMGMAKSNFLMMIYMNLIKESGSKDNLMAKEN